MKMIPVLIVNLRCSHKEMADLHAMTILYRNFRNIKGLLTEREVCTVKNQTEFFYGMDRATKERGQCKKQRSDISQYRPYKRGQ
jgi:hypothetical protein